MENLSALSEQFVVLLIFVVILLFAPIFFIGLDYWAGIRKARKRGEPLYSDKMKRTIDKLSRYYNAILAMMVVDVIQMTLFVFLFLFFGWETAYTIPVFTLVAVGFVAAIEIKSIWEPANVKEQREMQDVVKLAKVISENRNDPKELAEAIAKYMQSEKKE